METGLMARIRGIVGSPALRVEPCGPADDLDRGILRVRSFGGLGDAVKMAFGVGIVVGAMALAPVAMAQGVGYDAGVYGQSQSQVMQAGSAVKMTVLDTRAVKIEVAAPVQQQNSAMGYAITGAAGGLGAVIGANVGGNNASVHQAGAILGGLLGAIGGQLANQAMNAPPEPKMVDATEITMVNPASNQISVVTQAGGQSFSRGDHVLMMTVGGTTRITADRSQSIEQPVQQAGSERGLAPSAQKMVDAKDRFVQGIMHDGQMLGLQIDRAQVNELLDKGGPNSGVFTGKVVAVDKDSGIFFQSLGRGQGVVLSTEAMSRVPGVGEEVTVRIRDGQGIVSAAHLSKDAGRGRG